MHIELAVLADYAATTADGKLIIAGVFDTVRVSSFPMSHVMMYLALRMTGGAADSGPHTLELRLLDPDAQPVIPPVVGTSELPDPGEHDTSSSSQLIMGMANVRFTRPGPHALDILVDDCYATSVSFNVQLARAPQ